MCKNCGINSCGCSPYTPLEISTENVSYDGIPIVCQSDSQYDINTGDGLNKVFDLFKFEMCKLPAYPLKRSSSENSFGSVGPVTNSIIEMPPVEPWNPGYYGDGWYNVRICFDVHTQLNDLIEPDPQFEAHFIIGINGANPVGVDVKDARMYDKLYTPVANSQKWTTLALENVYYLTVGDQVSLTCNYFQDDAPAVNNSIRFNIIVTPLENFSYI